MISNYFIEKNINEYVTKYAEYILRDPEFYKKDEGYKYQAVATFRKYFDLDAKNFIDMLELALADTRNLIGSGSYFPKRMLIDYARQNPKFVRGELRKLLGGGKNVYERIDNFINNINTYFPQDKKQSYFDYRFVSFFLAAHDPEKHIHVKSKEYKVFAGMVSYEMIISGSQGQRYKSLFEFAEIIRNVIKINPEFKKVHKQVTEPFAYKDPSFSWGTDDFIFNVARRLSSAFNEEAKKAVKRNTEIQENKIEELEDMLAADDVVESERGKSREELIKLVKDFKPIGKAYTEREGSYRVRCDSAAQKERIKILENYACQICGFSFEYSSEDGTKRKFSHADHIIDKSSGGTEEADNIWILCPNCHAKKTLGVIVVNLKRGIVLENNKEIKLHHNNHLSWHHEQK
ncbi:MAG: HNH endonuclease signature motif containing protein [bacterium]|nr:HNH endonuclease signature motif containing protein [bacterium]